MNNNLFDNPLDFYKRIPKGLEENKEFRKVLHTVLEKDKKLQEIFLNICLIDPKVAYSALFFTANPRKPPGERNWPFILRHKQEAVVDTLKFCVDNQNDMGIDKSRDEGATELVCKFFCLYSLVPDSYFIVGSRKEELVDSIGDPYTLMAKIRYGFSCLPPWLNWLKEDVVDKDMQITVRSRNSVIRGETTNENFSAGRRATAMFLDEFGRVEPRVAESIEGSVHDVTGCVIYGSTHWYGENHAFNKALLKSTTRVVTLPWWENPEKNRGLYKSPDYDVIEIVDIDYYRQKCPEVFNTIEPGKPFKLSEKEIEWLTLPVDIIKKLSKIKFIADGCENLPGDLRSPWHDGEERKRKGNQRDFISNVWMSPIGSQDSVFNKITLDRVRHDFGKPPTYTGELQLEYDENQRPYRQWFSPKTGKNRLQWFSILENNRPDQKHNYVIGCDVALGTGASNSVAVITDVNTKEQVGTWTCPNTSPEKFADIVSGLARWCGGTSGTAYVIFENNGGHGVNFGRRLKWNGITRIYTQRVEIAKLKTTKNRLGWASTTTSKEDLLGELGIALSESLKTNSSYRSLIVHDVDILDEMRQYVFYEGGDIGVSEEQDLKSGARKRHGDRVIAVGLCVLGSKYQARATITNPETVSVNSFKHRQELLKREEQKNAHTMRKDWYPND